MANITKNFVFNLPDELGVNTTTEGYTANATYSGPDRIWAFVEETTNKLARYPIMLEEDGGQDYQPMPGLRKVEVLAEDNPLLASLLIKTAFTLDDTIVEKTETLSNGETYTYEWPQELNVYEDLEITHDASSNTWNIPFVVFEDDWEGLIRLRNSLLEGSDGRIASDMPAELRQTWLDYRQQLRDLPAHWDGIPSWKVTVPTDPDFETGE